VDGEKWYIETSEVVPLKYPKMKGYVLAYHFTDDNWTLTSKFSKRIFAPKKQELDDFIKFYQMEFHQVNFDFSFSLD